MGKGGASLSLWISRRRGSRTILEERKGAPTSATCFAHAQLPDLPRSYMKFEKSKFGFRINSYGKWKTGTVTGEEKNQCRPWHRCLIKAQAWCPRHEARLHSLLRSRCCPCRRHLLLFPFHRSRCRLHFLSNRLRCRQCPRHCRHRGRRLSPRRCRCHRPRRRYSCLGIGILTLAQGLFRRCPRRCHKEPPK